MVFAAEMDAQIGTIFFWHFKLHFANLGNRLICTNMIEMITKLCILCDLYSPFDVAMFVYLLFIALSSAGPND